MQLLTFPTNPSATKELLLQRTMLITAWLRDLASRHNTEVSESEMEQYVIALVKYPEEALKEASIRGAMQWRFFPKLPEILDVVRETNTVKAAAQANYDQMVHRYLTERPNVPSLRSVLETRELPLTRQRRLALGLEEPVFVDVEGRIRELLHQAEVLLSKDAENSERLHMRDGVGSELFLSG